MPGAQVPTSVVDAINAEISNLRSSLESGSAEEIRSKVDSLQKALMEIGKSMSGGEGGAPGGAAGGASSESASGTYDADVKDDEK